MSAATRSAGRTGAPTHDGMPRLDHVDPDQLRGIGASATGRASAWPLLAAMGAPIFSSALGDHMRDDRLIAVDECLAGRMPTRAADIAVEIREACIRIPTGIAQTDLAFLRWSGINVTAALLLAIACDLAHPGQRHAIELWGPVGDGHPGVAFSLSARRWTDGPRTLSVDNLVLSNDVTWTANGVMVTGLPETFAASITGRPLNDLVSHPVLDRFPLTAGRVTEVTPAERQHVEIDGPIARISIDTLPEVRACDRGEGDPEAHSAFSDPTPEERWDRTETLRAGENSGW